MDVTGIGFDFSNAITNQISSTKVRMAGIQKYFNLNEKTKEETNHCKILHANDSEFLSIEI